MELTLPPWEHRPSIVGELIAEDGHLQFAFLLQPLCALAPRCKPRICHSLDFLERTPLQATCSSCRSRGIVPVSFVDQSEFHGCSPVIPCVSAGCMCA